MGRGREQCQSCQPNIVSSVLSHAAVDADCDFPLFEGLKMKKILGVAALILAFSPFAQAQGLSDHPEARNDRRMESEHAAAVQRHHAVQKHMKMKHHRRMEHKM